ncbi:MAG: alpha/beta hydrolase [Chloroflexota bacterium]
MTDRLNQTISLADGRELGFAEWGPVNGLPVFYFGGSTARFFHPAHEEELIELGVRFFVVERPGFGQSTRLRGRTVLDWPDDVAALADHLSIDKFAIIGTSQGGPYAAACAYKLAERLYSVTLSSALAPFDAPELLEGMAEALKMTPKLANNTPWLLSFINSMSARAARRDPEGFLKRLLGNLPESDQQILNDPVIMERFIRDLPEAVRQGSGGSTDDMRAVCKPWGFELSEIRTRVLIWQGEDDPSVPVAMSKYYAQQIPNSRLLTFPDVGHFLVYSHWKSILSQIIKYSQ